jgi:hypothetical protein
VLWPRGASSQLVATAVGEVAEMIAGPNWILKVSSTEDIDASSLSRIERLTASQMGWVTVFPSISVNP